MIEKTIELKNLSITYDNGHNAISNITKTLSPGKIYGLIGMNGAGKSTLFKAIMGFLKPNHGTVKILGQSTKIALKKNLISYVPQIEEIDWSFPIQVNELVMMGRYGHMGFLRRPTSFDKQVIDSALAQVSMLEFKKRQIGELSGGQRKRIFVARALAQESKIILLDEPFSGVDIGTEESLIAIFQNLAKKNHLIITSTHNLMSVPYFCDELMLINKTILASGNLKSTLTQENLIAAFGGTMRQYDLLIGLIKQNPGHILTGKKSHA